MEEIGIVIVGGGIAGLATSIALHRKGIKSVVLERAEKVRSEGAGIGTLSNGWRALDQLGVGDRLRLNSSLIHKILIYGPFLDMNRARTMLIENGKKREFVSNIVDEARCIKRNDLVEALSDALPEGTIRFGSHIVSIEQDKTTLFPVVHLANGNSIKAKVLIGCDGANSIVSDYLQLNPKKAFACRAVRGFTKYPNGHGFPQEVLRIKQGNVLIGRLPLTDNQVFWFLVHMQDNNHNGKDQESIANLCRKWADDLSEDWKEMVKICNVESLTLTHLRYRAPSEIMLGKFRRGTVTVAGDAMHVMGPFLAQGGSAALEDAVVLARCLARKVGPDHGDLLKDCSMKNIEEAIDEYVDERRMRLLGLSVQTYLTGRSLQTSSKVLRLMFIALLLLLFGRDQIRHTRYDCGRL
ncbi:Monooxygenase 1 [Arabidopsis thaliana]